MRHRLRRSVLRSVLLVLPVVVLAGCSVPGEPFAQRACEETATLLQTENRGRELVELRLADATGWADRAADVDRSFVDLREALIEVRDAVQAGEGATRSADDALAEVGRQCSDLGTPVEAGDRSLSEMGVADLVNR